MKRPPAGLLFVAVDFLVSAYGALWISSWLLDWFFGQEGRMMPQGQQHTLVLMAVLWARLKFGAGK